MVNREIIGTGLVMNYHALSPRKYKRSVVAGFVYRIHRACSSWKDFHLSLEKAKIVLERNQYPPDFYEPIMKGALENILDVEENKEEENTACNSEKRSEENEAEEKVKKHLTFIEYRGKVTDDFCRALKKIEAPCQPVLTLRKLKTVMPSLKPSVDHRVRSHVVYRIKCPRCNSCYIGATCRCIDVRFKEHMKGEAPVYKHLKKCRAETRITVEQMEVLASTTRSEKYLFTLEALWQKEERPGINTKDEYKRHELTVMW